MEILKFIILFFWQFTVPRLPHGAGFYHPAAPDAVKFFNAEDWTALRDLLEKQPTDSRGLLANALFREDMPANSFDNWIEAQPDLPWPWLFKGQLYTQIGWDHRGEGYADTVDEDEWESFFGYLEEAEQYLWKAADLAPDNPLPLVALVPIFKATREDPQAVLELFEQARTRGNLTVGSHLCVQDAISPKWGGDFELLEAFGDTCLKRARENGALACVVPDAHVEVALMFEMSESAGSERDYLRQEGVRNDVLNAHEVFVDHYDDEKTWDNCQAHNTFAYVFDKMKLYELSALHLRQTGLKMAASPWTYEHFPEAAFVRAHQRAGVWAN